MKLTIELSGYLNDDLDDIELMDSLTSDFIKEINLELLGKKRGFVMNYKKSGGDIIAGRFITVELLEVK